MSDATKGLPGRAVTETEPALGESVNFIKPSGGTFRARLTGQGWREYAIAQGYRYAPPPRAPAGRRGGSRGDGPARPLD